MPPLVDAVAIYHDLLTDSVAAASQAELERQSKLHQLYFGDRTVCSVLRPRFLTIEQYRFLRSRIAALMPAFQKAYAAALENSDFRSQFGLRPEEVQLLATDPGFADPSPTARLDSFFVSERELKFTEYNAETPAGAGYNDVLAEAFYALPVMRAFLRQYDVYPPPARPHVLDALLDSFEQWQGHRSDPPRIAILDWSEVPTVSEFRIFEQYFRDRGIDCRIVDPRKVEYADGGLRAGDFRFNLIYKRVLISELIERGGLGHPVVRAVLDGAVCMVNGFRSKILYKKASFAVLSDERNARLFTETERLNIADHIPWTRVVEDRRTEYRNQPIDLLSFIAEHREQLVLKPNDEYGGKGIVLGWTVDGPTWEAAIRTAIETPYVAQERVKLPHEVYPSLQHGKLRLIDRMLDTNPYIGYRGVMAGCLTRISTEALVNVTAGGGSTVPTFLVEERS
ncbi:MAG TPA: hypothetical protein VH120_18155 [Gemmataceae bacterium]|nr:hypothetical protein [Gemmataceae bacterium]